VVYYREDGVVPVAVWELGDQVHGYDLEGESVGQRGDSVEGYPCSLCKVFALLAFRASLHILCDPFVHVGPPEVLADDRYGGVPSLVSSGFQVVESVEDFFLEGIVWWDGGLPLHVPVSQVIVIVRVVHGCLVVFDPLHDLRGVLPLCRPYPSL
jgi:hypothetical protein